MARHWQCLFFYDAAHDATVRAMVRRYALAMDGNEAGAQEKRCDFETMDPAKGTDAGYIAKNIDGYSLEKDLEGNNALETSARVEAWATRRRIRQFGASCDARKACQGMRRDLFATLTTQSIELRGRDNASMAWDKLLGTRGGGRGLCGRDRQ